MHCSRGGGRDLHIESGAGKAKVRRRWAWAGLEALFGGMQRWEGLKPGEAPAACTPDSGECDCASLPAYKQDLNMKSAGHLSTHISLLQRLRASCTPCLRS